MKRIQLQIPRPCHENWDAMSKTEQRKFCAACCKEVIDFSEMNDRQIVEKLKNAKGNACGRFTSDQLNRTMIEAPGKKLLSWKYFWQLLIPAFFATKNTYAQGKTDKISYQSSEQINCTIQGPMPHYKNPKRIARVVNAITGEPIPGASIRVDDVLKAFTDSSGLFSFIAHEKIQIRVSSVGYEKRDFSCNDFKIYGEIVLINLTPVVKALDEVVLISGPHSVKGRYVVGGISTVSVVHEIREFLHPTISSKGIYPNPAQINSSVNYSFATERNGWHQLYVYDIQGRNILSRELNVLTGKHTESIFIDKTFAAGTYIINVVDDSNRLVQTSKLVVQ